MTENSPVPGPSLADTRERTIQLLIESFASDRLSVEEFESRLDRAHRAQDIGGLEDLVSDLPVPTAAEPKPAEPAPVVRPVSPLPDQVRERQYLVACLGGTERKGSWTPARKNMVLSIMGGTLLDFREAHLAAGVTEVDIFAMMGGIDIIVPPGVVVDSSGIAILGSFAHGPGPQPGTPTDAPVIRIGGLVIMGSVEIKVRMPGESARQARKRLREERRQLRRGGTGN